MRLVLKTAEPAARSSSFGFPQPLPLHPVALLWANPVTLAPGSVPLPVYTAAQADCFAPLAMTEPVTAS
jgi:hypothetical protein